VPTLPAACDTNYFNKAGRCEACLGEATSVGQTDTTCSCGSAGITYNTSSTYDYTLGCACAAGHDKSGATTDCDNCLANHYKGADGKCKLCIGGASSAGGAVTTCSCSSAGSSYDTSVAYKDATGCTCATGYAKPSGDDDGECSECASGYEYQASGNSFTCTKCVGDQITTSGKDSCSCPNTPAYSGQKDSSGCGERVMPCIVKAAGLRVIR
jgi:hypothetical protein